MTLRFACVDLESRLPNITNQYLMPRHGILAVATAARLAGYEVSAYVESLNGIPYRELLEHDVIGASVTGSNVSRVRSLFAHIRRDRPAIRLLAGGPHATLIPTDIAPFVDVVVRDEGEQTVCEVLQAFAGNKDLDTISGISIPRGERVLHTPRRPFAQQPGVVEDLSLLRGFRRKSMIVQLLRHRKVYCGYTTTSRGCPFPCTFCYENMIGGTSFRKHGVETLIDDIRSKRDFFGTRHFWLADSNFTTQPAHCAAVLRGIIEADLGCQFSALCRVDVARRPEIMRLMRDAGFKVLVLGMEAIQNDRLADLDKRQTVTEIIRAIDVIHEHDMRVIGLFMVGFDEDTAQTPQHIVSFAEAHGVDSISLYCLTEYPSLPGRTLPRYRVCETDLDYYNGHFVTTFPRLVPPSVLERAVFRALNRFYNPRKIIAALRDRDPWQAVLQSGHYLQIRKMRRISHQHCRTLEAIERPYYDRDGRLNEEALRRHPVVTEPLHPDVIADWQDPAHVLLPVVHNAV